MDSYSASTGANQWETGLPNQNNFIPAMDDQTVYIYYGASGDVPGPNISTLYAIDRQSGNVDYTIQNPSDLFTTYSSISSVVLGGMNDAIVIGNTSYSNGPKQVTDFNLSQRSISWTLGLNAVGALAVADGIIAVPTSTALDLINEATGSDLWSWTAPANHVLTSNVILTMNRVFVASNDTIFAIDRASGQLSWSQYVGTDSNSGYGLAYYNGMLYASGASKILAFGEVPEPSSILALLCGTGGMAGLVRRKKA